MVVRHGHGVTRGRITETPEIRNLRSLYVR